MENIKVPKKVERHAIKAVNVLCEGDEAKCVTESEILQEVRYQMRNLVPVANIKGVLHKCLVELSARCIIRRVDDENFGICSDRDSFIFQNNGESLPLPMLIKKEIDADDSGDGVPYLHLQA